MAAALVKTAGSAISAYAQARAGFRAGESARRDVTDAFLRRGRARAATEAHAAIAVRLREVERGVSAGVLGAAKALAQIVPLAGVLVALSPTLAAGAALTLAPFLAVLAVVRRGLRARRGRATNLAEKLHAALDELVRPLDLWRTFGAGARVRAALDRLGREAERAAARAEAVRSGISGANEALAAFALLSRARPRGGGADRRAARRARPVRDGVLPDVPPAPRSRRCARSGRARRPGATPSSRACARQPRAPSITSVLGTSMIRTRHRPRRRGSARVGRLSRST